MGWTIFFIVFFGIGALVPAVWSVIGVINGKRDYWPAVIGSIFAVVLLVAYFIAMAAGWGGCGASNAEGVVRCEQSHTCAEPNPWGDKCSKRCPGVSAGKFCPGNEKPVFTFCEEFSDGLIKQPWSNWSDLSFIASGLWILWGFRFFRSNNTSPMRESSWLFMTYACIVISMGPLSMILHSSMKAWAGWADTMSVVLWLGFNAAYVFYFFTWSSRGYGRGKLPQNLTVLGITLLFVVVFGISTGITSGASLVGYFVTGGLWGLFEILVLIRAAIPSWRNSSVRYERPWWLILTNIGVLAVTMTIWVLFNPDVVGGEFCQAVQGFPGHAFFHILAAVSTYITYLTFVREKSVAGRSG